VRKRHCCLVRLVRYRNMRERVCLSGRQEVAQVSSGLRTRSLYIKLAAPGRIAAANRSQQAEG
jgi:hypothetical protein